MLPSSRDTSVTALGRGQGISAWRQITDALQAEILGGALPPGAQVPTEAVLAERFGVNRHTVRRALSALAQDGLVRSTQGRGTFVETRPLAYPIGSRTRFSEIVSRAGREAEGTLIASREQSACEALAESLRVEVGATVLELTTCHRADATPISTARAFLPLPRFAGFARAYGSHGSITRAFADYGITDYLRLSTRITARIATAEEASTLELAPGRVVMVSESVNTDIAGVPIQATRSVFAADRVEFVIEPSAPDLPPASPRA